MVEIQPKSKLLPGASLNPINGSWWLVQILPKEQASAILQPF